MKVENAHYFDQSMSKFYIKFLAGNFSPLAKYMNTYKITDPLNHSKWLNIISQIFVQ